MDESKNRIAKEDEINLIELINIIWKRKWLIIVPTFILVVLAGTFSALKTPVWEVDSLILPAVFTIQTQSGQFEDVLVTDPKQITGKINEGSYKHLIMAELNLDIQEFPKIESETLEETNLVRIQTKDTDINRAKAIQLSLFNHLKSEMDKKIDVEIKNIDTQIEAHGISIQHKNLEIKDDLNNIKLKQIKKNRIKQQIINYQNLLVISKEREESITEEMKSVMERLKEIETQQRKALAEQQQEGNALSLLLYSNEIQQNLRYYNTLDEKLSNEKINQENLNLSIHEKEEELKQVDTEIENLKNSIDKKENEIKGIQSEIEFLKDKKARIDFTQLIKEPTSSIGPVAPRKIFNIIIAGLFGLCIFTILAFLIDYIQKQKNYIKKT